MGKIMIIRDADADWNDVSPEWKAKAEPDNPGLKFKRLLPTAEGMPNMQRTIYEPHHLEAPHAHPEDEILYLLGGTILAGTQSLTAGDALYVARDTTYTLKAGAEGAEFLRVGFSL
jgi:quercetin dioxygenase-like cupin family protein